MLSFSEGNPADMDPLRQSIDLSRLVIAKVRASRPIAFHPKKGKQNFLNNFNSYSSNISKMVACILLIPCDENSSVSFLCQKRLSKQSEAVPIVSANPYCRESEINPYLFLPAA
jgi:hypothetical protein